MYWDAYTVWAVICGLAVTAMVFVPALGERLETQTKVLCVVFGLGFALYGVFVAAQTSGTWRFPVLGYALPLVIVLIAARDALRAGGDGGDEGRKGDAEKGGAGAPNTRPED